MPAHPALRLIAPLVGLAVAEVVLEVTLVVGAVDVVMAGVAVGVVDPEDV